jgi:hypothetical protein
LSPLQLVEAKDVDSKLPLRPVAEAPPDHDPIADMLRVLQ